MTRIILIASFSIIFSSIFFVINDAIIKIVGIAHIPLPEVLTRIGKMLEKEDYDVVAIEGPGDLPAYELKKEHKKNCNETFSCA